MASPAPAGRIKDAGGAWAYRLRTSEYCIQLCTADQPRHRKDTSLSVLAFFYVEHSGSSVSYEHTCTLLFFYVHIVNKITWRKVLQDWGCACVRRESERASERERERSFIDNHEGTNGGVWCTLKFFVSKEICVTNIIFFGTPNSAMAHFSPF